MASVVTVKTEKRPAPVIEDGDTVAKKARYENNRCVFISCQRFPKAVQVEPDILLLFIQKRDSLIVTRNCISILNLIGKNNQKHYFQ